MTNGTENSRIFQISGKKDNRLSIYLTLYRKFRLNRSRGDPVNKSVCLWTTGRCSPRAKELLLPSVLFERSMCPWRSGRGSFEISEASRLEENLSRASVIRLQLSRKCAGRIGIHLYFDSMKELGHQR